MVLDASILLAIIAKEPRSLRWDLGFARVKEGVVSAVNFSEVVARLAEGGLPEREIRAAFGPLGVAVIPFDAAQAVEAGMLRPLRKGKGLSLGDRACLSLARRLGRPALTTDRAWAGMELGVEIVVMP